MCSGYSVVVVVEVVLCEGYSVMGVLEVVLCAVGIVLQRC